MRWGFDMRNKVWAVAALAAGSSSGAFAAQLLAGSHGLTAAQLELAIIREGRVLGGANEDGFFLVEPYRGKSLDQLGYALRVAGVDWILPSSASTVDRGFLPSVRDHAGYRVGAFDIRVGRLPFAGEISGAEPYQALAYFLEPRVDPATGRMDHAKVQDALRHRSQMPAATRAMLDPSVRQSFAPVSWAYIGPNKLTPTTQPSNGLPTLSGRKHFIAHSTFDSDYVYVASAGGGIWRATDTGVNYSPMSNDWPAQATTCVALDPLFNKVVYAGTGDRYGTGLQQPFGIMKSVDGGVSWENQGAAEFGDSVVTRIKVSTMFHDTLVALTAGPSGDIWRSTDGGATWARTDAPDGDWDDIDASSNDNLWVAVSATKGMVKSTNQGLNWTPVTVPGSVGGTLWDVAISKLDPARWYLVCGNRRFYTSVNSGGTWTNRTAAHDAGISNPAAAWAQGNTNLFVECGTTFGADIVLLGTMTVSGSDDNGLTWNDLTHSLDANAISKPGQHYAVQKVGQPGSFWICGDGGLLSAHYDTATNSLDFAQNVNDTFTDAEMHSVSVSPSNSNFALGGMSKLGGAAQRGATGVNAWKNLGSTSTGAAAFDKSNPAIHYLTLPNGGVDKYPTATATTPTSLGSVPGLFITPLVCADTNGSLPIAGDTSGNLRGYTGAAWDNRPTGGGPIRTIAVSKFAGTRLYTGSTTGDIYRTNNTGGSFTKVDGNLPNRSIGGIVESPFIADNLIVGLQGTGNSDVVYRCTDATAVTPTWVNRSGVDNTALPSISVNDVERDPFTDVLYAATDVGVFVTPDVGGHWYNMNSMGLPNVPVLDLWIYKSGTVNYLYAATYGRGIWRCFLSERYLTDVVINKPAIYGGYQNTVTLKMNGSAPAGCLVTMVDTSASVSIPSSVTIPTGATQYTFSAFTVNPPATETVTITARVYSVNVTGSFVLHKIPDFTLTPDSPNIYGGNRFYSTLDMSVPAPITAVFTFTDDASQVASPASTAIEQGQQFKLVPYYSTTVQAAVTATIGARLANTTHSNTLVLHPRPNLEIMNVTPNSVVGGADTTGKVIMDFVGMAGAQVVTVSDTSTLVTTPPSVSVPGGALEQTFEINTMPVTSSVNVLIKGNLRGITKAASLTIRPQ